MCPHDLLLPHSRQPRQVRVQQGKTLDDGTAPPGNQAKLIESKKNTSRKPAGRNAPAKALAGNRQAVVSLQAQIIH